MAKDVMEVLAAATNGHCEPLPMLDAHDRIAELLAASPDMAALFRAKWGNLDPDANAVYERFVVALAACRGLA
jgi:hypothetical protein